MKKLIVATLACCAALGATSCYNTRLYYGSVDTKEPMVEINKEWNHHLIYGLVPLNNAKVEVAEYVAGAKNFMVKTNQSFLNGLVSGITFGIYTPTQTKFYVPLRDLRAGGVVVVPQGDDILE